MRWTIPIAALLALGCKKPDVEIDEGLPLPLPPGRTAPEQPAAAVAAPDIGGSPLTVERACELMDAHMSLHRIKIGGRQCKGLETQRETARLKVYRVPRGTGDDFEPYQPCFWRTEGDDGWRVGYVFEGFAPCVTRDRYCTTGSTGALRTLSRTSCPGDRDQLIADENDLRGRLTARWKGVGGRSVVMGADGSIRIDDGERTVSGHYRLLDPTHMEVSLEDGSGIAVGFAMVDGFLHLAPHAIATSATDREAFLIHLSESKVVRRFRGVCYALPDPAPEEPQIVDCDLRMEGDSRWLDVHLAERAVALLRVGGYWMEESLAVARYERLAPVP